LDESAPVASSSVVKSSAPAVVTTPSSEPKFDHWVDLKEFDFSMRYKSVTDSNKVNEFSNGQQRGVIDGKFKFDQEGKYAVAFHASSGRSFNWSYADFIGGGNQQAIAAEVAGATPEQQGTYGYIANYFDPTEIKASYNSGGWAFYVRRLYLDVEPVKGVEAQYGSLDINRGVASEITSYDNDGYISGARLLIKRPKNFFFDEASVTYAYFGDLNTPNFFERGTRLKQSNYHQFLLRKKAGKRLDASFDYTWQDKSNYLREDALVDVKESRVLDSVRVEFYQRLNEIHYPESPTVPVATGQGYAITAAKKLNGRISVDGGYADVDFNDTVRTQIVFSALIGLGVNGDQYGLGKRVFIHPSVKLTPYLEASCFYTKQLSSNFPSADFIIWNQQAFNAGLNFDMKKLLFPKSRVQ
jgi:hypothetical protein